MPRYVFSEGTSNKFWEIDLDGKSFTTSYGRIGSDGQSTTKTFPSEADAKKEYSKLVAEKVKKGYTEVGGEVAGDDAKAAGGKRPLGASNPLLEGAILADPDDAQGYLVYSDWLQAQGDPHGEIVALAHAGLEEKPAAARAAKLIQSNSKLLLGDLPDAGNALTLDWHLGFIRGARIHLSYEQSEEEGVKMTDLLGKLLTLPAARFIRDLTFGMSTYTENSYEEVIALLVKQPPKALRSLFLGDFEYPEETEMSWSAIGNAGRLWSAFPGLRTLILQGGGELKLGSIVAPELRHFEIRTGGLPKSELSSILKASWPRLERLDVWFGDDNYGGEAGFQDITRILAGEALSKLRHLGLMNAAFTDELAGMLPTAKILPQLSVLDLSKGTLSDTGARAIAAARDAFRHLDKLDLSENCIGRDGLAALKGMPNVELGDQREDDADDDERYVAVGE